MAKFAIVPASLVTAGPSHRMDAGYWVRVAERAQRLGVDLSDTVGMQQIQLTYAALYGQRAWRGLGELIEAAENF